jgi:GTP cyclohydrolase FolE2
MVVYLLLAQRNVHEHIVHQEDANRAAVRMKIDWLMSPPTEMLHKVYKQDNCWDNPHS